MKQDNIAILCCKGKQDNIAILPDFSSGAEFDGLDGVVAFRTKTNQNEKTKQRAVSPDET